MIKKYKPSDASELTKAIRMKTNLALAEAESTRQKNLIYARPNIYTGNLVHVERYFKKRETPIIDDNPPIPEEIIDNLDISNLYSFPGIPDQIIINNTDIYFVPNDDNHKIKKYNIQTQTLTELYSSLTSIRKILFDSNNDIYFTDSNSDVYKLSSNVATPIIINKGSLNILISSLIVDKNDVIYLIDSARNIIYKRQSNGDLTQFATFNTQISEIYFDKYDNIFYAYGSNKKLYKYANGTATEILTNVDNKYINIYNSIIIYTKINGSNIQIRKKTTTADTLLASSSSGLFSTSISLLYKNSTTLLFLDGLDVKRFVVNTGDAAFVSTVNMLYQYSGSNIYRFIIDTDIVYFVTQDDKSKLYRYVISSGILTSFAWTNNTILQFDFDGNKNVLMIGANNKLGVFDKNGSSITTYTLDTTVLNTAAGESFKGIRTDRNNVVYVYSSNTNYTVGACHVFILNTTSFTVTTTNTVSSIITDLYFSGTNANYIILNSYINRNGLSLYINSGASSFEPDSLIDTHYLGYNTYITRGSTTNIIAGTSVSTTSTGDGGPSSSATFRGIAWMYSLRNKLYVADRNSIRVIQVSA